MASKPPPPPPPRPPKPGLQSAKFPSTLIPFSVGCSQSQELIYEELGKVGPVFLLSEVAEQHSQSFPMTVEVSSSLYGVGGTTSLIDGELLNFHFLKKTECAQIMVHGNKARERSIPVNSILQFGALYDPTDNIDKALQGVVFKSVSRLMSTKILPSFVCVTDVFPSRSGPSLLAVGDILVLKNVIRKRASGGYLICHHMRRNQEIKLKEVWHIQFSTNPELIKLHLPDLLDHVALPLKALVCVQEKAEWKQLQVAFPNQVCTVLSRNVEVSVIATYSGNGATDSIMEIPTNFGLLSVRIIQVSSVERHKLVEKTAKLLEAFVPGMVDTWISDDVSINYNLLLRKHVCQSNVMFGITLIRPAGLAELVEDEYDYIKFEPKSKEQRKPSVSTTIGQSDNSALSVSPKTKKIFSDDDDERYATVKVIKTSQHESSTITSLPPSGQDALSANQKALGTLTSDQVLLLLDRMNLGVYKKVFKKEKITGDLMLELNESMLEEELGIKLRIHRIRIMKVITGQHSLEELMK